MYLIALLCVCACSYLLLRCLFFDNIICLFVCVLSFGKELTGQEDQTHFLAFFGLIMLRMSMNVSVDPCISIIMYVRI